MARHVSRRYGAFDRCFSLSNSNLLTAWNQETNRRSQPPMPRDSIPASYGSRTSDTAPLVASKRSCTAPYA